MLAEFPAGFRIGLTVGAIGQVTGQAYGMHALYKPSRNIKLHMNLMQGMLLTACLVPALMRLPEMIGPKVEAFFGDAWTYYSWVFAIPLLMLNFRAQKAHRWY